MENELSEKIIGAAIEVHKYLGGPGLLESIYESALCHELELRGFKVARQVPVPVKYKNVKIRESLQIDILVEEKIILEIKSTEKNLPIYRQQLLTYLKLTDKRLGMLINFGYNKVTEGVGRVVNDLKEVSHLTENHRLIPQP